jgi:hypothetical protein
VESKKSEHDLNIFSGIFSEGFVFSFPDKCGAAALRPVAPVLSATWLTQKLTLHQQG